MVKEKTYCFSDLKPNVERTPTGELAISGWSIHKGIYHDGRIEIPNSELGNIAESLVGKHLFKDHIVSTDTTVGRVTETRVGIDRKVGKSGVKYRGTVDDPGLERKINNGLIDNVSIGFTLFPECSVCGEDFSDFNACPHWFDTAHIIARNCECYEQSILPLGADGETTIEPSSSFSMDADFSEQFKYKLEKMEKDGMKTDENTSRSQTFTTDNSGQPPISITIPSITIPPIGTNTWGGETFGANKPDKYGENMDKVEKLQAEVDKLEAEKKTLQGELQTASDKIDELETENEQLTDKVTDLETSKGDLEEKLSETKTQLDEYVEADKEAEALALKTLKDEVIRLQIEKGYIKEEEAEEKLEELTDDEKALEQLKFVLAQVKEQDEEEAPPVGQFEEHTGEGETALPERTEKEEFDMKDEGLRKSMFKDMFRYPKGYRKEIKK